MAHSDELIRCPCCRGSGTVQLNDVYRETLDVLRTQTREINAATMARLCKIKGEAMANRLVRLETLQLARRRREGRQCLWHAIREDEESRRS